MMTDSDKYQRFDQFEQKRRSNSARGQNPQQLNAANTANSAQRQPKSSPHPRTQSRPRGQQQKQLDAMILRLHHAMVEKILAQPSLLTPLNNALEQAQQNGLMKHSAYLFWSCAFAAVDQPALFRAALLSPEPQACKYRRRTRLCGILSEEERQQILFGHEARASIPTSTNAVLAKPPLQDIES
jgi:hypothetical protein